MFEVDVKHNVLGMLVFVFERRQYLQEVLLGLLDEKY